MDQAQPEGHFGNQHARQFGTGAVIHELAITENILKCAVAEAEKAQAKTIKKIKLVVGEATSIVPECVQFYFNLMKENTLAQTAELDITTLPLRFRCPVCKHEYRSLDEGCTCEGGIDIISGQELLIEYIEVENGHDRSEQREARNEDT